jgi:ribosomal protein S18 acetylase RimI-like enzyme
VSEHAIQVRLADLNTSADQEHVVDLLDMYAQDVMGQQAPLRPEVKAAIIPGLSAHPRCCVFLAFHGLTAVGVAVCFEGFSTFAARPLLNIHDIAVEPKARGRGVGRALLEAVEQVARHRGCAKITLEVRADNANARHLYRDFGFDGGQTDSAYHFWTKPL